MLAVVETEKWKMDSKNMDYQLPQQPKHSGPSSSTMTIAVVSRACRTSSKCGD